MFASQSEARTSARGDDQVDTKQGKGQIAWQQKTPENPRHTPRVLAQVIVNNLIRTNHIKDAKKNNNLKIANYSVVLINSDYHINYKVKQLALHQKLVNTYKIFSTYEPCIYPGVNSKFYWNEDYKSYPIKGKCYCTKSCNGKGTGKGDGECKCSPV